ncbi:TPA: carbon storage regulator [Legionella pneumophila]
MLVLSRKEGEQILMDKGQIQVKILYIGKRKVAVGINAPANIDVDREELFLRKLSNPRTEMKNNQEE